MKENKLKINIPKGYEVDKELSTFEEIFFKKIEYSKLPRTWNEYRELTEGEKCYTLDSDEGTRFGCIDEFDTKKRAKEYAAIGQLMQLRDYWVRGYKEFKYALLVTRNENILVYNWNGYRTYPHILTFPTEKMAEDFKECFSDLIKKAFLLK